jgi:DNA-binding XRE family transcriptional regulator
VGVDLWPIHRPRRSAGAQRLDILALDLLALGPQDAGPVEPHEQFAINLRRTRRAAGLSQEQLADRCGLHATEISRLERGVREPRLSTIVRLARALEIQPSQLLADVG